MHQELKKALDSLKSATSKAPGELLTTMWEVDYQQALLQEEEDALHGDDLGDLTSRVEEVTLEEEEQLAKVKETASASFSLQAGHELPLPHTQRVERQDALSHGTIDITRMAEEVEREVEEERKDSVCIAESKGKEDSPSLSVLHAPVLEIKEDTDGEWIVLTSPEKRSTRMQIEEDEEEEEEEEGAGTEVSVMSVASSTPALQTMEVVEQQQEKVSGTKKKKGKSNASGSKKNADKKKKTKKSPATSGTALYSIERSLLSFRGKHHIYI